MRENEPLQDYIKPNECALCGNDICPIQLWDGSILENHQLDTVIEGVYYSQSFCTKCSK